MEKTDATRPRSLKTSSEEAASQCLDEQALSSGTGILGDVGDDIVEHPAGLFRP